MFNDLFEHIIGFAASKELNAVAQMCVEERTHYAHTHLMWSIINDAHNTAFPCSCACVHGCCRGKSTVAVCSVCGEKDQKIPWEEPWLVWNIVIIALWSILASLCSLWCSQHCGKGWQEKYWNKDYLSNKWWPTQTNKEWSIIMAWYKRGVKLPDIIRANPAGTLVLVRLPILLNYGLCEGDFFVNHGIGGTQVIWAPTGNIWIGTYG